jgi:hypothetical protein
MVKIKPRIVMKGRGDMQKRSTTPGVRVVPASGDGWTDDDMRRLLRHPTAGGFRAEGDIEWPNDTFTFRRLKEGSIKLSEQKQDEPQPQSSTGDEPQQSSTGDGPQV